MNRTSAGFFGSKGISTSAYCQASRSNYGSDAVGMLPDAGPLGAACQDDEGDAAYLQVLLVADAPVSREHTRTRRSAAVKSAPLLSVSQPLDCAVWTVCPTTHGPAPSACRGQRG